MRWIIIVTCLAWCGATYAQQKKQWFELPFAQNPPPLVKKIMEDAERDIRNSVKNIFQDTESQLKDELERLQEKKRLDEANFTEATLNVFKSWLLRNEYSHNVHSPVGVWHGLERSGTTARPGKVEFFPDGTTKATWHTLPGIWSQDSLGTIRTICTKGRFIIELKMIDSDTMVSKESPDGWRIKRIK